MGAHVGVGVDDTLAAALHDVEWKVGAGVGECALPAASNAGCCGALGERFSRFDRLRRAAGSDCRLLSPDGLRIAIQGSRLLDLLDRGRPQLQQELSFGQLPID